MKVSREFKVGLVALAALVVLYWGLNYLKGEDIFQKKKVFYAVYDGVDGLTSAKPVRVNGLQVGNVDNVYFHPDGSGRIMVAMNITTDFDIPKTSIASIQSNLLGDKSINLILGISGEPAESGDTLKSRIELSLTEEVNKQVAPLKSKAEELFSSIDTVLILISGFLNDETKTNFVETFSSFRRSVQRLENTLTTVDQTITRTQPELESSIKNVAKISRNLEENGEELDAIFQNLHTITDSLARVRFVETFASLEKAMVSTEEILNKVNAGEGSLGKLINDEKLYNNLEDASRQLDLLLLDIKYNPRRYIHFSVFGKTKTYSEEEILKEEKQNEQNR